MGIGFSIPINTVIIVLEQLYLYGKVKWGFIGVKLAPLTRALARQFGTTGIRGTIVLDVLANGPASLGGLQRRDIIIRVGNRRIKNPSHLIQTVSRLPIGQKVTFQILRNRRKIKLGITIGERP